MSPGRRFLSTVGSPFTESDRGGGWGWGPSGCDGLRRRAVSRPPAVPPRRCGRHTGAAGAGGFRHSGRRLCVAGARCRSRAPMPSGALRWSRTAAQPMRPRSTGCNARPARFGGYVFVAWWVLLYRSLARTPDSTSPHQPAGENVPADTGVRGDPVEPVHSAEGFSQRDETPVFADDAEGDGDRAGRYRMQRFDTDRPPSAGAMPPRPPSGLLCRCRCRCRRGLWVGAR